ncbi:hypothetical protein ACXYTP_21705 [Tsukamurella ocularis]
MTSTPTAAPTWTANVREINGEPALDAGALALLSGLTPAECANGPTPEVARAARRLRAEAEAMMGVNLDVATVLRAEALNRRVTLVMDGKTVAMNGRVVA